MAATSSFLKFENLSRLSDFIQWRRRVQALSSREDPILKCFQPAPVTIISAAQKD